MVKTITPQELYTRIQNQEKCVLIDVRTPEEFTEGHAPTAQLIPLDQLDFDKFKSEGKELLNTPIYFICRSGARSMAAAQKAEAEKIDGINVEGGMIAWEKAGLPILTGLQTVEVKKDLSFEQQERIVLGGIIVICAVLGLTVHPLFTVLSGFIGLGLIYSGMMDINGMRKLLMQLPWNRNE